MKPREAHFPPRLEQGVGWLTRNPQLGFTLIELAVAAIVIGVLATVLLQRLLVLQEEAEKAAMEATVRNIRSGLQVQVAELLVKGKLAEMPRLVQENPVRWLAAPPPNYRGEVVNPLPGRDPSGWYYDPRAHDLVYLVEHGAHFLPDREGYKRVRLRVVLAGASLPGPEGIRLELVEPYRWLP